MKRSTWALAALAISISSTICGAGQAATYNDASLKAESQPIGIARFVASIPGGQPWAVFVFKRKGIFADCLIPNGVPALTWQADKGVVDRKTLLSIFSSELKAAGLPPADDPDDLFQKERGKADLQVAGNVKSISANLCTGFTQPSRKVLRPDLDKSFGDIAMDVEWQIHSASADKVIAEVTIHSSFATTEHAPGGFPRLLQGGVRENIKSLIANPVFRTAAMTPPTKASLQVSAPQTKIVLPSTPASRPTKISDAVGSVMVIFSASGHGSGFLVSSDGYVLTAAHVPGSDKFVKVRWSDGLEGVGEVIRSNRRRDAALIKVDPRGRSPLALHLPLPEPGDTTFAIGAPIDPKLQSTVTRGVVSANRIMDGFSFIQSDVTVDPGNSGGPLLNEKGEVLGFTDIGLRPKEAPTGLNFFVPIRDALDFLSLEQR